jgi:hypothetical protein
MSLSLHAQNAMLADPMAQHGTHAPFLVGGQG